MSTLNGERVEGAIAAAGLRAVSSEVAEGLAAYGNLLLRWNARTNLTAVRDAEGVLQRHLVESVACAQVLPEQAETVLDFGTGAGLPGIPVALCCPGLRVTLAESQSKKAAFLREALRVTGARAEVFAGRVEEMPREQRFDVVTMRAVDQMAEALPLARERVVEGGKICVFVTDGSEPGVLALLGRATVERVRLPGIGHLLMVTV